jgi:integrase/recombinase XerD
MVGLDHANDFEDALQTSPVGVLPRCTVETVKVYTRHKRTCPKRDRPDWARCNCVKWLYVYRNGKDTLTSAKTRSWEKAEKKARGIRDSFDPTQQLQRQLEAKINAGNVEVEIAVAVDQFDKEVARLSRAEATQSKYNLTLSRLLTWCGTQAPAVLLLSQLDVPTLRCWIHSWTGAPTTRHNQHQRIIAFLNFCIEQGWIKENPAKKIKKVPRQQEETLPFTREQFDALIKATYYYDGRSQERNGATTNSRRARTYLKLLRWSGLRAGDGACLAKSKLRDDDSLVLYQAKVKGKANAPVCVLLPREIARELRSVPPGTLTNPGYFFWSGRSKRKSEVSNWIKIFGKILSKAAELFPELFLESNGLPKPAHLHMLRDTFAVEYLLAGMSLEEVSRLLGHSSVLITQKHYAPWVLQRQQHLVASQRKAWVNMGLEEKHHGPKMTREYRPRKARRQTSFHDSRSGSAARGRQ